MPETKTKIGRIGWPKVFQYKQSDGTLTSYPPNQSKPYTIIIHDEVKYQELLDSGIIFSSTHRGKYVMVDNRKTS